MPFPETRLRRLRRTPALRALVRETRFQPEQLIYPLFIQPGTKQQRDVPSMPGVANLSVDLACDKAKEAFDLGIRTVILFGIPERKDAVGSEAWSPKGVVQRAIRELKRTLPALTVVADACFCEYTDHGHCGVLQNGQLDNDASLENLGKLALSYAEAGADVVAPSGMLDGFVSHVRETLDEQSFDETALLAYSAKYASAYYGPFRDAAHSSPSSGDRRGYQMSPPNVREAMREIAADVDEGADLVMIKPALAYLDIIAVARQEFDTPIVAYNVSGEYAMVKAAAANGWIDEKRIALENTTAMFRAGADAVISYHALDLARWISGPQEWL